MIKHFKVRISQTKEETIIDIFAKTKNDALIDYLNHHHDKEKGLTCTIDIKEVK